MNEKTDNLQMYCISMEPSHFSFIKNLGYIPVGLGNKDFGKEWLRDNTGKNIADMLLEKNLAYKYDGGTKKSF